MALPDYPITRNEQYLSRIAGENHPIPDYPITREEQYLAEIAEGGIIPATEKGAPGGVATLDADGKVPEEQLPGDSGMSAETYDPDGSVADAGGIPAYVAANAPVTSVNGKTGDVELKTSDLTNDSGFITDVVTDAIEAKIPAQASAQNQLADKAFVNSSVQTATANFRGNWATWAAVPTDATQYPVDYAGVKIPSTNDYLVVVDASDFVGQTLVGTWRFKYSGTWATDGKAGWHPEYQVNESPLTAAQLAALNSGITAELASSISGKENAGKITIGGVQKTANSHTVTIVTNGETTNLTLVGVS